MQPEWKYCEQDWVEYTDKSNFKIYIRIIYIYIYIYYLFSHLADAFIQSNLQMRTMEAINCSIKKN